MGALLPLKMHISENVDYFQIDKESELEKLKGWPVETLYFENNPLCGTYSSAEAYLRSTTAYSMLCLLHFNNFLLSATYFALVFLSFDDFSGSLRKIRIFQFFKCLLNFSTPFVSMNLFHIW